MTIGILGGGQLARMLALAALPLGLRCRMLDPSADAVGGHAGELVVGAYDDEAALRRLADGAAVVTFEFENVPARAAAWLQGHVPVAPHPDVLAVSQDRLTEKALFERLGLRAAPHRPADTLDELRAAVRELGAPCVVKTRRLGYDGKGQQVLRPGEDLAQRIEAVFAALARPGRADLIVEAFVPFERELSVLAVRGRDGATATWPVVENEHRGGILRRTRAPAPDLAPAIDRAARAFAERLLAELGYTGVLAVELFLCGDELIGNEMAPRVHNSGHWTIEGSVCSQFENHVRAVAGLPLGDTAMTGGCAATMLNLIGRMPDRAALLRIPGARLHDYGKAPRAGRKLGHVTCLGPTRQEADALAARVAALLPPE